VNKLIWKRIALALLAYPAIYFLKPSDDIINFFIASLLFTAILFLSSKWKDKEKEILPEWEGQELDEDNSETREKPTKKT
jgi:hypothetical protein